MNKIYKVIWSKVKNQYVVVSELAHSNGKQSRTSRNSIRSRIAALVVCGAIAAFGVFSAVPNSAYAADSDYIAFVTTEKGQNANENQGDTIQINGYKYTSTRIAKPDNSYTWYWVRDGYNIQLEQLERPGSDGSKDYVVRAFKDDGGEVDTSLVHSYQNKIEDTGVTTLNGKNLHSYEAGVYAGGSNGYTAVRMEDKWSEADGTFKSNNDPMIFDGKKWRQAERTDFKEVKFNEETGNYEYNGQIVATENLYVVDFVKTKGNDTDVEGTRLGCFVVDGKVYTGTVHGKNNEILMTGINEDNKDVTYWASEYTDTKATMARMPISEYNETISGLASDINAIHQDDIKEIQINQIDNGGSINLQTNGEFVPARDENGDIITDETGKPVYVAQGGKNIPGGITIRNTTNSGSEGNDVAVEISNGNNSFTVDAGSKVVGKVTKNGSEQDAGVGDANKTLTGLKINGVEYDLSQGKTYDKGDGISIDESTNKISVALAKDGDQNVSGLHFKDGKLVNDLQVTNVDTATTSELHNDGGNWTITKTDEKGTSVDLTNTTLSSNVSKEAIADNVAGSGYGNTYTISDTDGNTATLEDVASADTLKTIDTTKIGNLQYNNAEGDSDETSIVKNNEDLTTAVGKLDNKVSGGWNAKVGTETITVTPKEDGNNTLEFVAGNNVSITPDVENNKITIATNLSNLTADETNAVLYDDENKTSVRLGSSENKYTAGTEESKPTGGVKLTNVAYANVNDESAGSDAVNVDLLKDYVDTNGGGSWKLTTSQDDNETTVGKGNTVDLAGATDGEHQNIHVTQETQYTDGKVTGTDVKFDLDDKLVLGDNDQITIDGFDGKATIKLGNSTSGTATIGGIDIATTTTDGKTSSTIDGLTNNTWDNNNTNQYDDSKKAATEGQLYDALTGLSKEADVAVVHANNSGNKDATGENLLDTNANIHYDTNSSSSSIALGKDAYAYVQNGKKANAVLFGSDTYTGGIAIGENSKALNATVNIGVKDYEGKMGDVNLSGNDKYRTYEAMSAGETTVGSNSYTSGSLSTNIGSYNIITTKYNSSGGTNSLYALQNTGAVIMGTLNSIESKTSKDNVLTSMGGKISGVANSVIGMANKTQNSNGSLIFGTGNEITNSVDSIPSPVELSDIISGKKNDKDVTEVANSFRDSVSDRDNKNGGAVLAIGGGNKADYALNSQLIGVQNQITGTEGNEAEYNMVNGYQNTVTNGSNDTVIGVKNTVTGYRNIVLGDKHTVSGTNNIILGSSGKETTHDVSDTVIIGSGAQALTDNSVAVGSNAQVLETAENSVAIGNGSVADDIGGISTTKGTEAPNYAGLNPAGTVSVGNEEEKRTITNVAAGRISDTSTDAVNGSQLYATNQKVDAGWVATDGTNKIEVNPTETGTTTLNFAGDNNITVTADTTNKAIQVALNDKVYLGGDHTEDSRNIVLDGERGVIGLGSNIALDGRDGKAVIGGVNITTTAEEGTGKPVSTINGLSNTTWTGTTETPNRAATEGQLEDLSDTVNTGWYVADKNTAEDSTTGNFAVKPGETLTFNGDDNIDVEAKDHKVNVSLKDNITLGEGNSQININGNPENGEAALSIGDKFVVEQNGTTTIVADDGINNRPSQAQLTPDTTVTIAPSGVTFAGDDKGTTIIEGQKITSGGIVINGEDIYDKTTGIVTKGTITGLSNTTWDGKTDNASRVATEGQLKAVSDDVNAGWIATDSQNHEVNITPDNNKLNFAGDENVTVTAANNEIKVALNDDIVLGDYLNGGDGVLIGGSSGTISATNSITVGEDQGLIIDGQKEEIQGLSNTTWNEDVANAVERDSVAASTAATQGQLQEVSKVANAGWNASDGTNSISVKPNETLNFVGDENLTVSADGTDKKLKVSLNDNITLGEGPNQIQLNGAPGANDPALSVGTDKFVVDQDGSLSVSDKFNVDAETGNVNAVNSSGSAIMMNDDSVALNAGGNGIAISDEGILLNTNGINEDIKLVTKGTSVSVDSNGTTFTNVNTNETTNIDGGTINVGDKLVVDQDGTTTIAVNDGTVMGNNTTMTVNKDGVAFSAYGNGTTVIDGQTIYAGGVVINNNGSGTINGLTNTTWDDELAKQVANSEELQSTAATQGQLQQAVSEVAEVANAGWTASDGTNSISVKPNETLNFVGDENLTVSADGTDKELKVSLNDDITLGNPKAGNTEGERSFTINTTAPEGYVPESYKTGSGADFIDENGGFMLFATNTQGYGVFGVTAKGSAWAKDFKTYTTDIYGNNTQYSLNDVGDAVAQMSSYYNKENGKSYTVFSRYLNEAEKDNPFATVDENATRDIPLALRDDGAVLIGATIKDDDFTDNGIRINAETETTYDGDGNEVTNNIATITGLENTTWTPPAPVATFANEGTETSRAATEAQLNDLYGTVVGYNVDTDGVNYGTVTLGGGRTSYDKDTHEGGTVLNNVAYASGKDGSEAVNVDYLKDAISDAAENGSISTSDQHLVANTETGSNGVYKPNDDGNVNLIVSDEKGNSSTITIGDVASKTELDSLKTNVGDLSYSKVQGDDVKDGDSVTTAIGKLDNKIENISGTATDADNNTVTGGKINSDGTISLTQKDKDSIKLEGQLTDSGVVQEGTSFDKETGTITITSQDKYSGETSSVKVEGIASTEVVGATNKEDLATAYKDADKDGNATTEYITDSESMVEADVALDHAIQDVANTSYANDMVLSNRIDSVEKRLGNVEERIDKVGAMAAAIANLRTMGFDPEAPTEIAIGVGQYKSETGIAIGVFHYPNQDFMLSASLSSSGDELMGGIGATWKLGRKSAAERAKDEEARHLEQAEEMKKLAQQEKVKAQAQRHAKLLAERQQASQKNA